MPSFEEVGKPSNAGYIAKIDVNPDGDVRVAPSESPSPQHQFADVNIAWYGTDRVKVTLRGAGPAAIRQAYLSGNAQDVILDIVALDGGEA